MIIPFFWRSVQLWKHALQPRTDFSHTRGLVKWQRGSWMRVSPFQERGDEIRPWQMCHFDRLIAIWRQNNLGQNCDTFTATKFYVLDRRRTLCASMLIYRINLNLQSGVCFTLYACRVSLMVDKHFPGASRWGCSSDIMSTSPIISRCSETTRVCEELLSPFLMIEMTQSNIRGHCCASMALLIKQTFHPHNSNVWT